MTPADRRASSLSAYINMRLRTRAAWSDEGEREIDHRDHATRCKKEGKERSEMKWEAVRQYDRGVSDAIDLVGRFPNKQRIMFRKERYTELFVWVTTCLSSLLLNSLLFSDYRRNLPAGGWKKPPSVLSRRARVALITIKIIIARLESRSDGEIHIAIAKSNSAARMIQRVRSCAGRVRNVFRWAIIAQ